MKTTRVKLPVSVERIGREGLLAVAQAEIDVHGIVITIRGLEMRRDKRGKLRIDGPGVSHGDKVLPAVELPRDLEAPIRREITALV